MSTLTARLLVVLREHPGQRLCLRCIAQAMDTPVPDAQVGIDVALATSAGIMTLQGRCDRCGSAGTIVTLREAAP